MNTKSFIEKYIGKSIDFDKAYGPQCVDLFRQYVSEVLALSQPRSVTGAADFWTNYDTDPVLNKNFVKIPNDASFVPKEGDVAIWNKKKGGGYGHIAICTEKGDTNKFESFDQNWLHPYCELVEHDYVSFYGVLRPNNMPTDTTIDDLQNQLDANKATLADVTRQRDELAKELESERKKNDECITQLNEAKSNAEGFRKDLNDFIAKLAGIFDTRQEKVEIVAAAEQAITFEDKASKLDRKIALQAKEYQATIDDMGKELDDVKAKLAALEDKYKALKESSITHTQIISWWDKIKSIFGGK